jgi:hypothetical protein
MRRFFRYAFLGFTWLFLAAIVVQVYFAGLMLFGQEGGRGLHEGTGYILGTAGALFLVLPALARAGGTSIVLGVVLTLTTFFQPNLTFARDTSPMIAALHPVVALLILALSVLLVRRATELVRQERGTRTAATASAAR